MSVLYSFFDVITSFGFSFFFTLKDFDVMILGYLLFYNWNRKKSENLISKLNSLAFKLIFFLEYHCNSQRKWICSTEKVENLQLSYWI